MDAKIEGMSESLLGLIVYRRYETKRNERVTRKRRGGGSALERAARVNLRRFRKDGVLLLDRTFLDETFTPCHLF